DLPSTQLETLLSKTLSECLNSSELKQLLDSLDGNLLKKTLPTAGGVLAKELPPFYNWLKNELGVERIPDSPDHTTKWVIGFINNQQSLTRLVELHRPVPRLALESAIPRLIGMFKEIENPQVQKEWQKAIAVLCLPLVVAAHEAEKSKNVVS
ncbi:MAG: hypothetical protein ICV78_07375, partial [Tolypothrix sp. Co-bin9]|nr:hypothetical protein [Tolypothrix sp. Co-bin9]